MNFKQAIQTSPDGVCYRVLEQTHVVVVAAPVGKNAPGKNYYGLFFWNIGEKAARLSANIKTDLSAMSAELTLRDLALYDDWHPATSSDWPLPGSLKGARENIYITAYKDALQIQEEERRTNRRFWKLWTW